MHLKLVSSLVQYTACRMQTLPLSVSWYASRIQEKMRQVTGAVAPPTL